MKKITFSIFLIIICLKLSAQTDSVAQNYEPIQFTLVPPLSTDKISDLDAAETEHSFSVNFLGYNGGLKGLELGIGANVLKYEMQGMQAAVAANITKGKVKGAQFAGATNIATEEIKGAQFAGAYNLATEKLEGAQFAPVNNALEMLEGGQVGVVNLSTEKVKGAQIGVVNIANNLKGCMLGVVNVADTVKGVPIGLLNIIKDGYSAAEISHSDMFSGIITYRMGTPEFYNLFSIGIQDKGGHPRYGLGYGLGTNIRARKKNRVYIEAIAYHVNENENWTEDLNLLSKLNVGVDIRLFHWMSISAGPSLNVMVSDLYADPDFEASVPELTTTNIHYDKTENGTNVKLWVGYNIGIRLGNFR